MLDLTRAATIQDIEHRGSDIAEPGLPSKVLAESGLQLGQVRAIQRNELDSRRACPGAVASQEKERQYATDD